MKDCFLNEKKRNIKKLIEDLSKILKVDTRQLAFLEKKMDKIILNQQESSLENILNNYFSLLESEMASLIEQKITAGLQFGIQNNYFTFIGYDGKFTPSIHSKLINENTYFSFDSISKILTSAITMMMIRDGKVTLDSTINSYNSDYQMNASIESILKFTAMIQTEKRIDNLSSEETIEILKRCRENIEEKKQFKNYYQYNDIGYMILRLSIPDFLERLDTILTIIDKNNLTYQNTLNKDIITGGKIGFEYITPDTKGRNIPFPGHTGLYGNIQGLLNLFEQIFYTNHILTPQELEILLKQPYEDPLVYTKDGNIATNKNNRLMYMAKIAGIYRKPEHIHNTNFSKIITCDFSNLTTDKAMASLGTCGSWVMGDNLFYQNKFGPYVAGILTNPYTYIKNGMYPNKNNIIPNTGLVVNEKGTIIGYPSKLNSYKNIIAEYGILLELLTEYIKNTELNKQLDKKHIMIKKLKKSNNE